MLIDDEDQLIEAKIEEQLVVKLANGLVERNTSILKWFEQKQAAQVTGREFEIES
jgi:hypothetical protein